MTGTRVVSKGSIEGFGFDGVELGIGDGGGGGDGGGWLKFRRGGQRVWT